MAPTVYLTVIRPARLSKTADATVCLEPNQGGADSERGLVEY